MGIQGMQIKIGAFDVSSLSTDEDFERAAKSLLPGVLERAGKEAGRVAWERMQAGLKRVKGFKPNTSSTERLRFIREAGDNFRRELGTSDRRELEQQIIASLREMKHRQA